MTMFNNSVTSKGKEGRRDWKERLMGGRGERGEGRKGYIRGRERGRGEGGKGGEGKNM